MKKRNYSIGQQHLVYVLLVSLFLQSCHNNQSIPNAPGKGTLTQAPSLGATSQEEEVTSGLAPDNNNLLTMQGGEEISQTSVLEKDEKANIFNLFPQEVSQHILSYIPSGQIGNIRQVNRIFYRLTTGYPQPGQVGVANKPTHHINADRWMINRQINFKEARFKALMPSTIPSLLFYQFLKKVKNLPPSFWPYLKGTHIKEIHLTNHSISASDIKTFTKNLQGTKVRTVSLSGNTIGSLGAQELAKTLPNSQIHTLNLGSNQIGDSGAQELAKALPNSKIHTLDLTINQIGDSGAQELAKALPNSKIHTLDLTINQIGNSGAQALAKALPNSKIQSLDLANNQIGDSGTQELAKALPNSKIQSLDLANNQIGYSGTQALANALPHSQIHTLHLWSNQIGDSGAQELAKALSMSMSQILTFNLSGNQITLATQKLLREQYPNIQWNF